MRPTERHRAKKALGQNFLADDRYISRITKAISPMPGDTVIEIGPGLGALTAMLVKSGADVVAIELDKDLFEGLKEKFGGLDNFRLIEGDALEVDYASLTPQPVKLAANLPYNISTAILQRLAEHAQHFSSLILMLQMEVVERITATPGSSARGFLTVIVEASFKAEKLFDVPPDAFRPRPKVMSSVVKLTPRGSEVDGPDGFRRLVSVAFAQKRKTILNNLKGVYPEADKILADAGIEARRRAEDLSLDEWLRLHAAIERQFSR